MTDKPLSDTERREKLWDLIKDVKVGLFTTHHANGHLHSRPMTLQNKDLDEGSRCGSSCPAAASRTATSCRRRR
ncbi:pyridoxamine 5'-phosphate oxidase family protein [Roseateles chitinivorans]|uniref:pyridoxamine 5'-phosphate oxidase family protein n=1 Tax=Roseateles chitinivorans TaxID=2917965 RepID=UPI003D664788